MRGVAGRTRPIPYFTPEHPGSRSGPLARSENARLPYFLSPDGALGVGNGNVLNIVFA